VLLNPSSRLARLLPALIATLFAGTCLAADPPADPSPLPQEITRGDFPPNDLKITSTAMSSGTFELQFDNLDPLRLSGKAESAMYMIAGVPGKLPAVEAVSIHYTRDVHGQAMEEVYRVPPGIDVRGGGSVARVADLATLRHLHVYTLTIATGVLDPEVGWSDTSYVLRSLRIRVDVGQPMPGFTMKVAPEAATAEAGFLKTQVLNADIPTQYWLPLSGYDFTKEIEWSKLSAAASAEGQLYRFRVYGPGLYKLTAADLSSNTRSSAAQPIGNWRIYHGGSEVPALQQDDALVLPLSRESMEGRNEAVYWLSTKSDPATSSPLRISIQPPQASTSNPSPTASSTTHVQRAAETARFEDYHVRLHPTPVSSRWYWKGLLPNVTGLYETELPLQSAPDGPLTLEVQYGIPNYSNLYPSVRLFCNGVDCGAVALSVQQGTMTFQVPPSAVHAGTNLCGLRPELPADTANPPDVLVQSFRYKWTEPLGAKLPQAFFNIDETTTTVSLFAPMCEQRAAAMPLLVAFTGTSATVISSGPSPWKGVASYDKVPQATGYSFVSDQATTTVRDLQQIPKFKTIEPVEADYLAVVAPELAQTIEPLVAAHTKQNQKVLARDVQSVFDQFTYGERDGEAIRKMCRYLYSTAQVRYPRYLLLVGECSDYRGDPALLPPGCQLDMVPTIGPYVGEGMHGDHGFAQLTGDDVLADLAVGRLSVTNADELSKMLTKFDQYSRAELGDWIYRAQFLVDDNDEFPRVAQQVVARSMAPPAELHTVRQADFTYVPNLRVQGRKRSRDATAAVLEEFQYGSAVQNFFGHGGPNLWSHERLFHLQDLPLLHNAERLPLVTCLSCDNAWMDYPVGPAPGRVGVSSSMGELLVRKADGGAIALFGPVAGASPYEHQTLVTRLMEAIYRQDERQIGRLTMYAKNMYYNETRSASLPEQYVLLGDPALELRVPHVRGGLTVDPPTLVADAAAQVTVVSPEGASGPVSARMSSSSDYLTSTSVALVRSAQLDVTPPEAGSLIMQWNPVPVGTEAYAARVPVRPAAAAAPSGTRQ
jgi:hypothetical protein